MKNDTSYIEVFVIEERTCNEELRDLEKKPALYELATTRRLRHGRIVRSNLKAKKSSKSSETPILLHVRREGGKEFTTTIPKLADYG